MLFWIVFVVVFVLIIVGILRECVMMVEWDVCLLILVVNFFMNLWFNCVVLDGVKFLVIIIIFFEIMFGFGILMLSRWLVMCFVMLWIFVVCFFIYLLFIDLNIVMNIEDVFFKVNLVFIELVLIFFFIGFRSLGLLRIKRWVEKILVLFWFSFFKVCFLIFLSFFFECVIVLLKWFIFVLELEMFFFLIVKFGFLSWYVFVIVMLVEVLIFFNFCIICWVFCFLLFFLKC